MIPDRRRRQDELDRLDRYARLLDSLVPIPGTGLHIGVDSVLGLLPGVGDGISTLMSLYIVGKARALGAPSGLIVRMLGNVLVDGVVGSIPLLGDLFDFAFKANRRNVALLRQRLERDGDD